MGEIGYNRREYLYELTNCDILLIERGYELRHRHLWSASRWETYHIMAAQIGTDGLKQAGIQKPADLIPLPGDKTASEDEDSGGKIPTAEEAERMRQQIIAENAAAEAAAKQQNTET